MTFKKDYINYLLYTVVNSRGSEFKENYRLRKLVDSIMSIDDVMKITFLIGKTAGLEVLFKYLLYISDKIDKSKVTVFNLKDNFEYDIKNLTKICRVISEYKSENVTDAIENIADSKEVADRIKIEVDEEEQPGNLVISEEVESESAETDEDTGDSKLTLIENTESSTGETEVFELESISESVENTETEARPEKDEGVKTGEDTGEESEIADETSDELSEKRSENEEKEETEEEESETHEEKIEKSEEVFEIESLEKDVEETKDEEKDESEEGIKEKTDEITDEAEDNDTEEETTDGKVTETVEETAEEPAEETVGITPAGTVTETVTEPIIEPELPEIEIEVRMPSAPARERGHLKEESVQNEAYYKFESKFFEEVKILEKLFASVDKDCRVVSGKLSEKCLQCLTEIIEISSELSNLSRQLSFDLIADIFFTMNIYFTKAISLPELLTSERIKLLDSSLALVNSLIKGEDYLNYDTIADKIEKLKSDISKAQEEEYPETGTEKEDQTEEAEITSAETIEQITEDNEQPEPIRPVQDSGLMQSQMDSASFKLKYLIREFEKSFKSIGSLKGEYSKFDALEKVSELNNALRLIAKISAEVKMYDALKLAEVTYVFLKYVKDYRMDLLEPEIQQIVKYIIFTFKMLLTNRKPEDFNVLVKYLNNPVKIFTDS